MKKNDSKKTGTKKKSKKNNNVMFGIGCVVLGLLVIMIFFLVNKDQIFTNLKETDFFDNVFGATPQVIENHEITPKNQKEEIPLKNDSVTITIENENSKNNIEEEINIQNKLTEPSHQDEISNSDNPSEIVQEQKNARNGDIVVAMNDNDEVTLKTFYKEKDHIRLQPENDTMAPIILPNCTILGKAIGLYRYL